MNGKGSTRRIKLANDSIRLIARFVQRRVPAPATPIKCRRHYYTAAFITALGLAPLLVLAPPILAAERQLLQGHVPEAINRLKLQAFGRLAASNRLHLAIGLSLRNTNELSQLLHDLYDPASPQFRHYLTPEQFTEKFGSTKADYGAVIAFAKDNGLEVTCTQPNRMLVDVSGSAAEIERTLHIKMLVYQHPTEARTFFAPDSEPSLDLAVPVLFIVGLNNLDVLLDNALMQLSEKDRQAVLLRYFQNRSLADIGSSFGVSEDAARMRINRALEKLHRYFSKRGIASTLAILGGALSANSVQAVPVALAKSVSVAALAQGTVTHGSTLILIEGALKLMAWAKAKTAIAIGTALLLVGGSGVVTTEIVHAVRAAHYPDIQGTWEGVMLLDDAGVAAGEAARTRLVLKITKTHGEYSVTSDWIELGRKDVPMGKVDYDYPALEIERNMRDKWKLTLNDTATQMVLDHSVHFIQPAPVLLRRTTTPDPVPERLAAADFTPRTGSDLQGYWKGAIGTGSDMLPVNLKIAELTDGTFRAEGDNPMQGTIGRPVLVTYQRPTVKFTVASGSGLFEGVINDANSEISGSWTQGGQSTPAYIKRADYEVEHARDSLRSYAFESLEELQGHWKGTWIVPFAGLKVPIRYALDIAKLPDGSYSAMLANIDQFGNDAPILANDFYYERPNVRLGWKWADGKYKGRLKNGKLVGTWFQNGGGFPLVFERNS